MKVHTMKQIWDGINDIIKPETEEGIIEDPLQVAQEFNTFSKEKNEKLEANINKNPNIESFN